MFYDWNDEESELRRFGDVPPWTPVGEFAKRLQSRGIKADGMPTELVEMKLHGMGEYERRREEQFNKREEAEGMYGVSPFVLSLMKSVTLEYQLLSRSNWPL